jgi:hypothetical protein
MLYFLIYNPAPLHEAILKIVAKAGRFSDFALSFYQKVRQLNVSDMKNAFFWDVTPCGSCKNRRFGGT